jgi:HAE1 family hydrophobic/amphiphilic exporter-1
MTLFLMPTVYYVMNRRSDQREAKAEARRERIAAGLSRKAARARINDAGVPADYQSPADQSQSKGAGI